MAKDNVERDLRRILDFLSRVPLPKQTEMVERVKTKIPYRKRKHKKAVEDDEGNE
jgi:hypothetical protein